jgi:hypothetical protein
MGIEDRKTRILTTHTGSLPRPDDVSALLFAGRIQFYVAPPLAFLPHYRNKELKIIAVTSAQRLNALPNVPNDYRGLIENSGSIAESSTPAGLETMMQQTLTEVANPR